MGRTRPSVGGRLEELPGRGDEGRLVAMASDYIIHLIAGERVGDVLLVPGEEELAAGNRRRADMCGVEDLGLGERSVRLAQGHHQFVQFGCWKPRTGSPGEEPAAEPDEGRIGILAAFVERRARDD